MTLIVKSVPKQWFDKYEVTQVVRYYVILRPRPVSRMVIPEWTEIPTLENLRTSRLRVTKTSTFIRSGHRSVRRHVFITFFTKILPRFWKFSCIVVAFTNNINSHETKNVGTDLWLLVWIRGSTRVAFSIHHFFFFFIIYFLSLSWTSLTSVRENIVRKPGLIINISLKSQFAFRKHVDQCTCLLCMRKGLCLAVGQL